MKESTLKMNLVKRDNEAEISLIGWLDATNAPDAQKVLEQQAERFDRIELDLKELEYISSAGLRALKVLQMKMSDKGERVVIRNVRKDVKSVFNVTGFYRLFKFED